MQHHPDPAIVKDLMDRTFTFCRARLQDPSMQYTIHSFLTAYPFLNKIDEVSGLYVHSIVLLFVFVTSVTFLIMPCSQFCITSPENTSMQFRGVFRGSVYRCSMHCTVIDIITKYYNMLDLFLTCYISLVHPVYERILKSGRGTSYIFSGLQTEMDGCTASYPGSGREREGPTNAQGNARSPERFYR